MSPNNEQQSQDTPPFNHKMGCFESTSSMHLKKQLINIDNPHIKREDSVKRGVIGAHR